MSEGCVGEKEIQEIVLQGEKGGSWIQGCGETQGKEMDDKELEEKDLEDE